MLKDQLQKIKNAKDFSLFALKLPNLDFYASCRKFFITEVLNFKAKNNQKLSKICDSINDIQAFLSTLFVKENILQEKLAKQNRKIETSIKKELIKMNEEIEDLNEKTNLLDEIIQQYDIFYYSEIINEIEELQDKLKELLALSITENKPNFVEFLLQLENGINLKEFLSVHRLRHLYRNEKVKISFFLEILVN